MYRLMKLEGDPEWWVYEDLKGGDFGPFRGLSVYFYCETQEIMGNHRQNTVRNLLNISRAYYRILDYRR
jgi:hypothetical protein